VPSDSDIAASLSCFDFDSAPLADDTLIFTCKRVWESGHPVRYVCHDNDGSFQFLCLGDDHTSSEEVVYIHARHIFEGRPDQLRDFMYLRKGCFAEHQDGETWRLGTTATG